MTAKELFLALGDRVILDLDTDVDRIEFDISLAVADETTDVINDELIANGTPSDSRRIYIALLDKAVLARGVAPWKAGQ